MTQRIGVLVALVLVWSTGAPAAVSETPRFVGLVSEVSRTDLPHSYRPGCPVGPSELRLLRVSHWGFDGSARVGRIVVSATVASDVLAVFRRLYAKRFPIRRLQPVDVYRGSDSASMAADNTSGFNCRYAVAPGPRRWSAHAYGLAIDVNPVENPYLEGGVVRPRAGAAYLDRSRYRPGMAVPGGELVGAFQAIGWQWGGRWRSSPDYQHFSATGG
jgi:hypothetical protein